MNNEEQNQVAPKKRGRPKGSLKSTLTLKQVLKAIKETGGVVSDTIKLLNIDNSSFYEKWRYMPEVEKALNQARQMGFEAVTEVLYKQCLDGDKGAITLYLRYNPLAKYNQWVEGQTITLKAEKPLSDEEKKDLVKELFG